MSKVIREELSWENKADLLPLVSLVMTYPGANTSEAIIMNQIDSFSP
jgi:hypothetical protein